jgi:hypothetical protein
VHALGVQRRLPQAQRDDESGQPDEDRHAARRQGAAGREPRQRGQADAEQDDGDRDGERHHRRPAEPWQPAAERRHLRQERDPGDRRDEHAAHPDEHRPHHPERLAMEDEPGPREQEGGAGAVGGGVEGIAAHRREDQQQDDAAEHLRSRADAADGGRQQAQAGQHQPARAVARRTRPPRHTVGDGGHAGQPGHEHDDPDRGRQGGREPDAETQDEHQ